MYIASQNSSYRNGWDSTGISFSILCIFHCLITPLLITVLPILSTTERQTNGVFAIIVLSIGLLAFFPGYRQHKKKSIPVFGMIGALLISLAALLPELKNAEVIETSLVLVGGTTLIFAHLRNAYWCRFCDKCGDTCCDLAGGKIIYRCPQ